MVTGFDIFLFLFPESVTFLIRERQTLQRTNLFI